jgi:type VI secretion system protein ImpJ
MQSMPVPPRQIPFNAGFVYYEIAQGGPLWDMVMKHGGIGLHVAGEFPSLQLQLWGIRG